MVKFLLVFICLLSSQVVTEGMLVKDWGTGSQTKRLAWSTKSFFDEVYKLMTLGQKLATPISGFNSDMNIYNPNNPKDKIRVDFIAYNGWLENLKLNASGTRETGKLRRFIMTSAEKHVHAKDITHSAMKDSQRHHEIIICDECLVFQANGFHFAYESMLERPESYSWGTIDQNGPISFPLSFHMTVMTSYNKTTLKRECVSTLEDIKIFTDPEIASDKMTIQELGSRSNTFSFLADDIQSWVGNHFNTTVVKHLQLKISGFASTLIKTNNVCKDFLTGGIFVNVRDKNCN